MNLAKRVRDYRYAKGWGPDELASRADISRTALYQIESGKTETPRAGTLQRIARALEVPIDDLLADLDPEEAAPLPLPAYSGQGLIPAGGRHNGAAMSAPVRPAARVRRLVPQAAHPRAAVHVDDDQALLGKFLDVLDSPLRDGVARIIAEAHRLLNPL